MALMPNFEVRSEGSEKFLRIRRGGYVRPFIDGETIKTNWKALLVAWRWRVTLVYEAEGSAIPALGRAGPDMHLLSWGLCAGQAGSLVFNDTAKTTSLFFGIRAASVGNTGWQWLRSAASGRTDEDYLRPTMFRHHIEGGVSKAALVGHSPFFFGADYWTSQIAIITRNLGTGEVSLWGSITSPPDLRNIPISEPIDILNQWSPAKTIPTNLSDVRGYAVATYTWQDQATGTTIIPDTATYGALDHMEWGFWQYGYALDLTSILIKETTFV